MHIKYYVGGVNGVGKTTLLKGIADSRPDFLVIHGSQELMKWLGIPVGDYDALRALPQDYKTEQWGNCLQELCDQYKDRDIVVDGHYFNLIKGETTEVVHGWVVDEFDVLVLVTAPTVDILRRIDNDPDRDRALFRFDEDARYRQIEQYQQMTQRRFEDLVNLPQEPMPHLVIHHLQGQTDKAVEQFLEFDSRTRRSVLANQQS